MPNSRPLDDALAAIRFAQQQAMAAVAVLDPKELVRLDQALRELSMATVRANIETMVRMPVTVNAMMECTVDDDGVSSYSRSATLRFAGEEDDFYFPDGDIELFLKDNRHADLIRISTVLGFEDLDALRAECDGLDEWDYREVCSAAFNHAQVFIERLHTLWMISDNQLKPFTLMPVSMKVDPTATMALAP